MKIRCKKCGALLGDVKRSGRVWKITTKHTADDYLRRSAERWTGPDLDAGPLDWTSNPVGPLRHYESVKIEPMRKYHLECGKCWHFLNLPGLDLTRMAETGPPVWEIEPERFQRIHVALMSPPSSNSTGLVPAPLLKAFGVFKLFSVVEGNASSDDESVQSTDDSDEVS